MQKLVKLNVLLIIFDVIWCITMNSVWGAKPAHHEKVWEGFSNIHSVILLLSGINILLKVSFLLLQGVAVFFLVQISKGSK